MDRLKKRGGWGGGAARAICKQKGADEALGGPYKAPHARGLILLAFREVCPLTVPGKGYGQGDSWRAHGAMGPVEAHIRLRQRALEAYKRLRKELNFTGLYWTFYAQLCF